MTKDDIDRMPQLESPARRAFTTGLVAGVGLAAGLAMAPARAVAPEGGGNVNFERGSIYRTYDLTIDPDVLIDMLADWGRGGDYLPESLKGIIRTDYAPGSTAGKFPCTRRLYIRRPPQAGGGQEYYEETMLSLDPESRTAIYRVDGIGPSSCRNYIACVEVTDLGNGRSRMAFRTRFDLPPGGAVEDYIKRQEGVYQMMSSGLEQHAPAFIKDRRAAIAKYRATLPRPTSSKASTN